MLTFLYVEAFTLFKSGGSALGTMQAFGAATTAREESRYDVLGSTWVFFPSSKMYTTFYRTDVCT